MVQLKECYGAFRSSLKNISIPHGTIKRLWNIGESVINTAFQYLMVQLKALKK